jgi:tetratricopeptide (TPR) repeat protein
LEIEKQDAEVFRQRSEAYLSLADQFREQGAGPKMLEAYNKALQDLEAALQSNPEDFDTYWSQGITLLALDAFDRAVASFEQALALLPDEQDTDLLFDLYENTGEALMHWGRELKQPEKLEQALEAFQLAVVKTGDSGQRARCYNQQAELLLDLDRYPEALSAIQKAQQLEPENAWSYILQGKTHLLGSDYPEAQEAFEKALQVGQSEHLYDSWCWVGLGAVFQEMDGTEKAEGYFGKALAVDDAAREQDYLDRASILGFFRRYGRAEVDLAKAVELAPESADAHNALAWMYVERLPSSQNLVKAVDLAQRAVELEAHGQSRADYLDTLGWAYFRLQRFPEAVEYLDQALALMPYVLEFRHHLEQAQQMHENDEKQSG